MPRAFHTRRTVPRGWGPGGGTSAATPLAAAILALVLERERTAGRPPLGAANQLLYALARSPAYAAGFAAAVAAFRAGLGG